MTEEDRVLELDSEWNAAYPRHDVAALERIIADDWVCIDGTGLVIGKRQLLERLKSGVPFPDPHKFDETSLRMFGDTAIITGRLSGTRRDNDGSVNFEQRYTRVYVKRNDSWQAVATQVTVVGEERRQTADGRRQTAEGSRQ